MPKRARSLLSCFVTASFSGLSFGQTIPEFNIVALPEYDLTLLPTSQLV